MTQKSSKNSTNRYTSLTNDVMIYAVLCCVVEWSVVVHSTIVMYSSQLYYVLSTCVVRNFLFLMYDVL